ncbi:hypothetical protein D3C78_1113380 [compost metagenome]
MTNQAQLQAYEAYLLNVHGVTQILWEDSKARMFNYKPNFPKITADAISFGWEVWQLSNFRLPEGYLLVPDNNKFFSHDINGDGFTLHDTLNEAKQAAEADLDAYRERVADGSHIADMGEFDELTYGVVLGQGQWSVDRVVSEDDHKEGEYHQYEIGTEILNLYLDEAPSKCCAHCNDGDGECVFPYFGLAPHSHLLDQPKPEYPINYCDTDGGQGVYTHCLVCGADKHTLPFGAEHE